MKIVFAAAALIAATAAPALAVPAQVRTVSNGERSISYVVEPRADGTTVLRSAPREPSNFHLRVRNGWVDGEVEGLRVSFRAPNALHNRTVAD